MQAGAGAGELPDPQGQLLSVSVSRRPSDPCFVTSLPFSTCPPISLYSLASLLCVLGREASWLAQRLASPSQMGSEGPGLITQMDSQSEWASQGVGLSLLLLGAPLTWVHPACLADLGM